MKEDMFIPESILQKTDSVTELHLKHKHKMPANKNVIYAFFPH